MSLSKPVNSNVVAGLWQAYLQQLEDRPVRTKALTAATISVFSDALAQVLTGANLTNLNTTSMFNQFLIGLFVRGPFVHYWYEILEYIVRSAGFGDPKIQGKMPIVLGKVALDQLTFSPFFNLIYFYIIGALEGRSSQFVQDKIAKEFVPLMLMNYKVWPLVNVLNFKFVPPHLRVLFGNIVSLFWMTYVIKSTASN